MTVALLDALDAHSGIVCAVGAGGKKTTLYALAQAHPGRVGFTCTVFMARFSRRLPGARVITDADDPTREVDAAAREQARVAWARPAAKSGRVGGVPPTSVAACHAAGRFDVTLVKADGARMRAIKAPADGEPVIPAEATTVLFVVSAAAFGAPLDEAIAHRPERVSAVTGLAAGEPISARAVGRLLAAEDGAGQHVPSAARLIAVINAVDDQSRAGQARDAAEIALAASPRLDRVVLTRHDEQAHVVDIIERPAPEQA